MVETDRRLWEFHMTFGGHPRMLMEGNPLKYSPEAYLALSQRLDDHIARFLNHPMLAQEPYAGLCQLATKSAVIKVHTIGWLQNLTNTTNGSTIVTLCDDFLGVIKRLVVTGDLLYCSDLVLSIISLPGIFLHLVSGVQKPGADENSASRTSPRRSVAEAHPS